MYIYTRTHKINLLVISMATSQPTSTDRHASWCSVYLFVSMQPGIPHTCVCGFICVCIYIHICICIYIYMYIYTYPSWSMFVSMYWFPYVHVSICIYVFAPAVKTYRCSDSMYIHLYRYGCYTGIDVLTVCIYIYTGIDAIQV